MKIYVARQPIFEPSGKPFGYEFLYRDSMTNQYNASMDGTAATCRLISNMLHEFGVENLTGGAYAFVNFTEELLKSEYLKLLDPRRFIVEILETVQMSDELGRQLTHLKNLGYTFALDDYDGADDRDELADFADCLKVDFMLTDPEKQKRIARRFGGKKLLLAEKIETKEELDLARAWGYTLYQGYYFSKPVVLSRDVTQIATATYLRLWREIIRPGCDFDSLAEVIRMDVNLSYKFLHRVNSLQYYRGHRINNIKQALIRMGISEVKRWTLSILLRDVMGEKNNESAKQALIRAVFAEKLVIAAGRRQLQEDAYMMGLFSTIDPVLQEDLQELLRQLRIPKAVSAAILEQEGELGGLLQFVKAYDGGAWSGLPQVLLGHELADENVSKLYLESVAYAERMFDDHLTAPPIEPALILDQQRLLKSL